jgi:hypothetical protein
MYIKTEGRIAGRNAVTENAATRRRLKGQGISTINISDLHIEWTQLLKWEGTLKWKCQLRMVTELGADGRLTTQNGHGGGLSQKALISAADSFDL